MKPVNLLLFVLFLITFNALSQPDTSVAIAEQEAVSDTQKVNYYLEQSKKFNYSDPNRAYEFAKLALDLSEQLEYKTGKAEALRRVGIYYIYHNDSPKALDNIHQSLKLAEELQNDVLKSRCLMNLGAIYYDNRDFNQAINYFSKSLHLAKRINDKQDISNCLINFGNVYNDMGDFKLAIENYQNALKLYVEIQDRQGISKCLNNIGNVYFYQNNLKAALDYYNKSLKINEENNDKLDIITSLNCIGKVYLKMEKLDEALEYCTRSLDVAWEIHSQDDIQRACYTIASIYKKKADYKKALAFYQLATTIKDNLYNENKTKEFGKLEAKYQLEKQEAEIRLLKQDRILKSEQAHKALLYRNIIIGGTLLFFLGIISIVLYRSSRKEHKINLQLVTQNREIAAQSEALKTLNEELDNFVYRSSHDLKAPLTSVLGLINILKMDATDGDILPYLERIKKSVDKLMIVLQDLSNYSKNSRMQITEDPIDFKDIIEHSIDDLKYLDNFELIKIKYHIHGSGTLLSDTTRIQILLKNLLSNAIVHHNIEQSHPEITIDITISEENAKVVVTDNGKGIPDEYKGKVFDMFFKGSNDSQGSGLGLYISLGIIKKLEGDITFESEEGKGAAFTVTIPNKTIIAA